MPKIMSVKPPWIAGLSSGAWLFGTVCMLAVLQPIAAGGLCKKSTISSGNKAHQHLLSAIQNNKAEDIISLAKNGTNLELKTNLGDSLLHLAVICESADVVEALVKLGLDPNMFNEKGITPVWTAVETGNTVVMDILKQSGARLSIKNGLFDDSLLHLACRVGKEESVKWLLTQNAEIDARNKKNQTPLLIAIEKGHSSLVEILLAAGASVNCRYNLGETPLHVASGNGHLALVKSLIKHGAEVNSLTLLGLTPVHKASEGGNDLVIRELLKNGARCNDSNTVLGLAPIHMAAYDLNSVKALLENGAEVNVSTYNGARPIHWVGNGESIDQSAVVDVLVEKGAYVNELMKNGWTPLHLAALRASGRLVRKLVEIGADVNARDWYGRSPLHYTVVRNDPSLIDFLINNGAAIDITDDDGGTPLLWARSRGLTSIITRLEYWKSLITNY